MAKKKMKKLKPRKRQAAPVNLADMGRWAAVGLGASVLSALLLLGAVTLMMRATASFSDLLLSLVPTATDI